MSVAVSQPRLLAFAHLLDWSEKAPPWQQDALRRILDAGAVTQKDLKDLLLLCKHSKGIDVGTVPEARPPKADLVGNGTTTEQVITLCSIAELENVNAIDASQGLTFLPQGITVFFGFNGTGKSGYSRVLRHSCRSRMKGSPILPNVLAKHPGNPASAAITYAIDGEEQSPEQWIDGQRTVDSLGSISFFDSDCAGIQVSSPNDVAFTPSGLDVLPKLATVCKDIKAELTREKKALLSQTPAFLSSTVATGTTAVGELLRSLNSTTRSEYVQELAKLNSQETARLKSLQVQLADDPIKRASTLRTRAKRIDSLRTTLSAANSALASEAIHQVVELANNARVANQAAEAAARLSFDDAPLQGIGDAVWKQLWESARRFSAVAYPSQGFPVTDADSLCVLCQQPLSDAAKVRYKQFEEFVSDDTAKKAATTEGMLKSKINTLSDLGLRRPLVKAPLEELQSSLPDLVPPIRQHIASLLRRLRDILRAHRSGNWQLTLSPLPSGCDSQLAELVASLSSEADESEKASQLEERVRLVTELDELKAREWLATVAKDVQDHIHRQGEIAKLDACLAETRTKSITDKSKELAKEFVTDQLRSAFATEIKLLRRGLGRPLHVELSTAPGEYGNCYYQIRLVGAGDTEVPAVVSEGEHRCIALAGFLSELATEAGSSAIVLDDPVSSLDYRWSACFARRLVEEAQRRQVIVFTHDILFLNDLFGIAKASGVDIDGKEISSRGDTCGHVGDDLPHDVQGLKTRIHLLTQHHARINKLYEANAPGYDVEVKTFYDRLRAAIERTIEEKVFNSVILRYRNEVKVGQLLKVAALTPQHAKDIHALFVKCSELMTGHDSAALLCASTPSPQDLLDDLNELKRIAADILNQQKQLS